MKKFVTFLFASLIISSAAWFLFTDTLSDRERYEQFILEKAADVINIPNQNQKGFKAPDKPDMAAYSEYVKTLDPELGYVPTKRLLKAYQYTSTLVAEQHAMRDYVPNMIWESTGANMGGRTRSILFDPNDPDHNKVWAGGVTGGLWYTDDITNTNSQWVPIGDFWSNLAISCMAYDPNNTQTFYVGTGEAQTARVIYRESSGLGAGIFKSTDAGVNWELLASTDTFDFITDIAVRDEEGISVIYACVASGTYEGVDHESQPTDGLYRSVNSGQTWEQVLPEIPGSETPFTPADIEIASNGRIFIGTMENLDKEGGATVLFSDSGLAGSWTVYSNYNDVISGEGYYNIPARTIVAVAPSDPNRVYAQFAAGYNSGFTYYRGRYMAQSQDGGLTWSSVPRPDEAWSTLAWHAFILQVDPSDPDVVFTGGLDLWKSTNAGNSWRHISDWSLMYDGGGDTYVHADQHNIQYKPENPGTAIFSSDGGVFLTNTSELNYPIFIERNQGYNTLQFYSCAMHPYAGVDFFIGGLQDNGTLKYIGLPLNINHMIQGGDGAFCFWDQNDPLIYITSVYYNRYRIWLNSNVTYGEEEQSGNFISPGDYDYKNNILYSNAVSAFGGNANTLYRLEGIPSNIDRDYISAETDSDLPFSHIKYSPYSPEGTSTLFLGTEAGRLYKTTNAQSTPETTEIGSPNFPTAFISCVAVGATEDNLLVVFSNYGVSSVWLTMDGGESWIEKESNLPDMPIRWALFHPENNGQALLATEIGIWATNTLNEEETEWSPVVDGMANVRVDMLKLRTSDNNVLAASHGRGLFWAEYGLDIYVGDEELDAPVSDLNIFPNPTTDQFTVSLDLQQSETISISLIDLNGKIVYQKVMESVQGQFSHQIGVQDLPKATYILHVDYGKVQRSEKVLIR